MKETNQTAGLGNGFVVNHFYEKLGALRATNPQAFASMSPAPKIGFYAYETEKREHARLEAIRDEPEAA